MTTTYVRIQDRKYGTEGLFATDRMSYVPFSGFNEETARHGVSACIDLEALMDYYAQFPIEIGDDPVIITMEGEPSGDTGLDAEFGEYLIRPTRIVSVESAEDAGFFDGINARLDADNGPF